MAKLVDSFTPQAGGKEERVTSRPIDIGSPITSLAKGAQQFTAIADTDHGSALIVDRLSKEISGLAKAGVKHLLLEYFSYPAGHPMRSEDDVLAENILKRLNARPPKITEAEILAQSALFASESDSSPDKKTGTAYANLLINAMKSGIKVHFAGDDRGGKERREIAELYKKRQQYVDQNEAIGQHFQRYMTDGNYLASLKLSHAEEDEFIRKMKSYSNFLHNNYRQILDADNRRIHARIEYAGEEERAKRFIDIAKGEKAVVVFGRGHFDKSLDLNEAMDTELKTRALKKGAPPPPKTEVVEIWNNRDDFHRYPTLSGENHTLKQAPSLRIFAETDEVEIPLASANRFHLKAPQLPVSPSPAPALER